MQYSIISKKGFSKVTEKEQENTGGTMGVKLLFFFIINQGSEKLRWAFRFGKCDIYRAGYYMDIFRNSDSFFYL